MSSKLSESSASNGKEAAQAIKFNPKWEEFDDAVFNSIPDDAGCNTTTTTTEASVAAAAAAKKAAMLAKKETIVQGVAKEVKSATNPFSVLAQTYVGAPHSSSSSSSSAAAAAAVSSSADSSNVLMAPLATKNRKRLKKMDDEVFECDKAQSVSRKAKQTNSHARATDSDADTDSGEGDDEEDEQSDIEDDPEGLHAMLDAKFAAADDEEDFQKIGKSFSETRAKKERSRFVDDECMEGNASEDENEDEEEHAPKKRSRSKEATGTRRKDWYSEQQPPVEYDVAWSFKIEHAMGKLPAGSTFNVYGKPGEGVPHALHEDQIKSNIHLLRPKNFWTMRKVGTKTFLTVIKMESEYVVVNNLKASGVSALFRKEYAGAELDAIEAKRNTEMFVVKRKDGPVKMRGPIIPPRIFSQLISERDAKLKKQQLLSPTKSSKLEKKTEKKTEKVSKPLTSYSNQPPVAKKARMSNPSHKELKAWAKSSQDVLFAKAQEMIQSKDKESAQRLLQNANQLTKQGIQGFEDRLLLMVKACIGPGMGLDDITRVLATNILPVIMIPMTQAVAKAILEKATAEEEAIENESQDFEF